MKPQILLSAYNGTKYLKNQISSLTSQKNIGINIIARDDGSSDDTKKQLAKYKNIKILTDNSNLGVKKSFSTLLEYASENTTGEHFMFCDQDDVWKEDKVKKTFEKMQKFEKLYPNAPILIHTDLHVTDENLNMIDNSFWHYEHINPSKNSLGNLLMQNTITGCTTMVNKKLAQLAMPIPNECIMHDWWIGLVACAFGKIGYLNEPTMYYRQHNKNDTGAKRYSIKNIFKKIPNIYKGSGIYQNHLDNNIRQAEKFLEIHGDKLDSHSYKTVKAMATIKNQTWLQKRKNILYYGLTKNGFFRNLGLLLKI